MPVIGRLSDWCAEVLPTQLMERVLVEENARPDEHNSYFSHISQSDVVGRKCAQDFLDAARRQWQEGPFHRAFTRDLSSQDAFPWTLYLASTEWGRRLHEEDIDLVHLVWLGPPYNTAAFYVRTENRREWVIRPGSNRRPPVSEEEVKYIQWGA